MKKVKLGTRVKDSFTGFTGIATARTEWLFGCTRICIEPTELKDGKPIDAQWFDVQRVEVIKDEASKISKDSDVLSGGPQADPVRSIETG